MAKKSFKITLIREYVTQETADLFIEANNEEEAREKAEKLLEDSDEMEALDWSDTDGWPRTPEVQTVTEEE